MEALENIELILDLVRVEIAVHFFREFKSLLGDSQPGISLKSIMGNSSLMFFRQNKAVKKQTPIFFFNFSSNESGLN